MKLPPVNSFNDSNFRAKAKLAISLVTYNAEKYLPFSLKSLAEQTADDFPILIIDNGSADGTVRYIKENYPQLKLVVHPNNIGFAKAHNQGIAWSNSDYVMLLNQDVILESDYLQKAIAYLDACPEAAALTGKFFLWDFVNNKKTNTIDSLGLKVYKNHRVVDMFQNEQDNGQFNEITEVFGVSGQAPIYRRLALENVKINLPGIMEHGEYLDEDFFSYKEDVDLAFRLRLAGYKSFYYPLCVGYHDRSVKSEKKLNTHALKLGRKSKDRAIKMYSYKNHLLLLFKNEFLINFIIYFFIIAWYELKKVAFILLFEKSTLEGLNLFFRQKQKMLKKRRYIIKHIRKIGAKDLARWYQ